MRDCTKPFGLMVVSGLLFLLAACASNGMPNPRVPPPGGTANFDTGYIHGCNSGLQDADWDGWEDRYYKDALYGRDADYKSGWDQGYNNCYQYGLARPRPESDHGGGTSGI
jgi:hypothetical protein